MNWTFDTKKSIIGVIIINQGGNSWKISHREDKNGKWLISNIIIILNKNLMELSIWILWSINYGSVSRIIANICKLNTLGG